MQFQPFIIIYSEQEDKDGNDYHGDVEGYGKIINDNHIVKIF
jgi:hypothetical protein